MTPDELQELDAYLAQHIMGWNTRAYPCRHCGTPNDHTNWTKDSQYVANADGPARWSPSSNPAQALEVAEKIRQTDPKVAIEISSFSYKPDTTNLWIATIDGEPEPGYPLPLAISLAAKTWHQGQQT